MSEEYTYAVARIRTKEMKLLTKSDLNALLSARDYDECMRLLYDHGWGEEGKTLSAPALLKAEQEKTWSLMRELVDDMSVFNVFLIPNDFHNLKVSIKAVTRDANPAGMFIENGTVPAQTVYEAVTKRDYTDLPEYLRGPAGEALTALLQTGDGQLCDVILDKASLETVHRLGQESDNEVIRLYSELTVASADIKTAVRCVKTGKTAEFIKKSLASCSSLNVNLLASAAAKSLDDIYGYLQFTDYAGAVDALKTSPTAFEKWCDDLLTDKIKPQKWEPFSIGPLAAYIIARDNEIKAVRLILSAKLNALDSEAIKERLRDMYV